MGPSWRARDDHLNEQNVPRGWTAGFSARREGRCRGAHLDCHNKLTLVLPAPRSPLPAPRSPLPLPAPWISLMRMLA